MRLYSTIVLGCLICNVFGQDFPTIREIFDYNAGEEFHFKLNETTNPYPHADRVKILMRIYDSINDEILYVRSWDNYYSTLDNEPEPHLVYHTQKYFDTLKLTSLDSTIDWYLINEENFDTVAGDTSFQLISFLENRAYICNVLSYVFKWSYSSLPGHGNYFGVAYVRGLGRVLSFEEYESQSGLGSSYELFYYHKTDSTCGIPDTTIVTEMGHYLTEDILNLYPNPCQEFLIIQGRNLNINGMLRIYNMHGQKIFEQSTKVNWNPYLVSTLDPGCYILEISQTNETIRKRFIRR